MNADLINTSIERIVRLQAEHVTRIKGAARMRVARGSVWLTVDGQLDDHFLRSGDCLTLGCGAQALVQAIGAPASVVVAEAAPLWPQRAVTLLQAMTRRLAGVLL